MFSQALVADGKSVESDPVAWDYAEGMCLGGLCYPGKDPDRLIVCYIYINKDTERERSSRDFYYCRLLPL